jgi:hypothetical protein
MTSSQDQDGSGGIGFEEVCGCLFQSISKISKLTCLVQFEPLWNYMTVRAPNRTHLLSDVFQQQWRQMFESFDTDDSGTIDANELSRALAHYKYGSSQIFRFSHSRLLLSLHVGPPILNMLVKKYGESNCWVIYTSPRSYELV